MSCSGSGGATGRGHQGRYKVPRSGKLVGYVLNDFKLYGPQPHLDEDALVQQHALHVLPYVDGAPIGECNAPDCRPKASSSSSVSPAPISLKVSRLLSPLS
ncbi:Hypothetical predicted protein [Olea europaea subsp. europaea]|uniref:Uncharacterized protein n=1 Tax=Olea europaea subsp. europaea TaxID=158383 RepID=A0A8S0SJ74_OLEEU|nr:Hypothetical predicted protein [Olea europaea subsp. europaea]